MLGRGRDGPSPVRGRPAPRTDPSVRDYRTGLLARVMASNRTPPRFGARDQRTWRALPGTESGTRFAGRRSPRAGPFPPAPPRPVKRRCSAPSQVLRACPTSRGRSSRAYRLSVSLASRHPPTCHPANHPGRGIIDRHGRPRDLPVLSMKRSHACTGSPTPRGPLAARENAASDVAFRQS